ncbi:MAG: 1-deoxy-D-xylulose-5-phosphate reductoisomerase [Chloroflexota bacterium]
MSEEKKYVTIFGSTGSIGSQTIDALSRLPEYSVDFLTVNSKIGDLERQVNECNPLGVVVSDEAAYKEFKSSTSYKGKILCGEEGLLEAASSPRTTIVLSSLVGFAGVKPTIAAINAGKTIALANKETLVSAGEIVMSLAKERGVPILAVDSEHSAIMQCLAGESAEAIEKLILTASGGPFRDTPLDKFADITLEQALRHPNWNMGAKITIDSATMMNKGFEIIEARWLFDIEESRIDVLIHPQSITHSLVAFRDGSVKAQLGMPDMRAPITYALTYPRRLSYDFPRLDLSEIGKLEFYKPDFRRYPCLELAYEAIKKGGGATCALNAANEVAVNSFLTKKIKFTQIARCAEAALKSMPSINSSELSEVIALDRETRAFTYDFIKNDLSTISA